MNTNYLKNIVFILSSIFCLLLTPTTHASISEFNFDNGLKLIVKENHRAPIFISQIWYKIGSSYEELGTTGISHMLEHMMFKGTKNYNTGEFSKIIAKNGGTDNAFTSRDYTAYYQMMNSNNLEISLKLEADRMQNLLLKEQDFKTERDVVIEERRLLVEDNPIAKVYEKLSKISYSKNSAYYYPIIGIMDDLKSLKLAELSNWYKKYYSPNNAIIVVVGDVDVKEVYSLVKKYFSHISPYYPKSKYIQSYPKLAQNSSLTLVAKNPYFVMSYPVPSLNSTSNSNDAYALEMLSYVLTGNDNAILTKLLVRELQLVNFVAVSYYIYDKYATNLKISFSPIENISIDKIVKVIDGVIANIKNKVIDNNILSNIKTQSQAEYIYSQDSIKTQAYYLGVLEAIGLGYKVSTEYVDKINNISAKDVQNIAIKYLIKNNRSTVELIPSIKNI